MLPLTFSSLPLCLSPLLLIYTTLERTKRKKKKKTVQPGYNLFCSTKPNTIFLNRALLVTTSRTATSRRDLHQTSPSPAHTQGKKKNTSLHSKTHKPHPCLPSRNAVLHLRSSASLEDHQPAHPSGAVNLHLFTQLIIIGDPSQDYRLPSPSPKPCLSPVLWGPLYQLSIHVA